jgi:hypothetical protein
MRNSRHWKRIYGVLVAALLPVSVGVSIADGSQATTPPASNGCSVRMDRSGPWGDVYNEAFTVTNHTAIATDYVRLTIQLPAGHTFVRRWYTGYFGDPDMSLPILAFGTFYPGQPLGNAGFQARVAAGADPSLRPVVTCQIAGSVPATTTPPTTTPPTTTPPTTTPPTTTPPTTTPPTTTPPTTTPPTTTPPTTAPNGILRFGGSIWVDANNDGIRDPSERGFSRLGYQYKRNGVPIATGNVNDDGSFEIFETVPSERYSFCLGLYSTDPGFRGSNGSGSRRPGQRDSSAIDSNVLVSNDDNSLTLPSGEICTTDFRLTPSTPENLTLGVGLYDVENAFSIGLSSPIESAGMVWNDANNDGIQNFGERGLGGGVVVRLIERNSLGGPDRQIAVTVTPTSGPFQGAYQFSGLAPGNNYVVCVVPPNGFASSNGSRSLAAGQADPTAPDPNNYLDGDDNGATTSAGVCSGPIILGEYQPQFGPFQTLINNPRVDFGLYQEAVTR